MKRAIALVAASIVIGGLVTYSASGATRPLTGAAGVQSKATAPITHWCNTNGITCTEPSQNWEEFAQFDQLKQRGVNIQPYIGHDEPSVLFYSDANGSGNDNTYQLRMPQEASILPRQDGSGGTWNFQQHIAPWLGMALCDDQSSPNPAWSGAAYPNVPCAPNSDSNIFTSDTGSNSHYIGRHPGTAYMEMQFYPPGYVAWPLGISCDAHRWCAAINIWSLSIDYNTGTYNNDACLNTAGVEPGNFAWITKSGIAPVPANPLSSGRYNPPPKKKLLLIGGGDQVNVHMADSNNGFRVVIDDLTNGTSGSMTASVANGFGSVVFDPNASTCSVDLHAFHPEYATSSPDTRVPWAAHSYNVAYSDEIGHFEYCNTVTAEGGRCTSNGESNIDGDDAGCFSAAFSLFVPIGGCIATDNDFDGTSYQRVWPGTNPNRGQDTKFHPSPGKGCVKPPPQSRFYPFFSTINVSGRCYWQEGGPYLKHISTFGGIRQYGKLLVNDYPTSPPGTVTTRYNDFRQILGQNPCPA
jgi:hypothetical protein